MLFALLRASLHGRAVERSFFQRASSHDWWQCYNLSASQGVMALAWDAVMRLPDNLLPPFELKLTWAARVEAYEEKYDRYCRTAVELSEFYAGHGIAMMQLKGVGFSRIYPVPSHRQGGDIDIYIFSARKNLMTDDEANSLANRLIQEQGIEVDFEHTEKHSVFFYKGIPVENHRTLLNAHS